MCVLAQIVVVLQPVESLAAQVHGCLTPHLSLYNEEFGNVQLDIMLSENIMGHVIHMHHIFSFSHGPGQPLVLLSTGTFVDMARHVLLCRHVDTFQSVSTCRQTLIYNVFNVNETTKQFRSIEKSKSRLTFQRLYLDSALLNYRFPNQVTYLYVK